MIPEQSVVAADDGQYESFDPSGSPDGAAPNVRRLAVTIAKTTAAALCLPLALYFVLRPENYGLTPNPLDPFFYTGYAINFDDIINAVRDRHYFVSRWSAYYPGYVANAIAGPIVGRLLLRLVLAAAILGSIWSVGARWSWTRSQRLLIGVLVLTMPIFVRAFFTDYVEYMVVALGICLVATCLRERQTIWSASVCGVLAALIVVANPIAITSVFLPLIVCVLLGRPRFLDKGLLAGAIVTSGVVVVAGGLVLFRWRYGISNVYQPSIDFMRNYQGRDGLKSPRLDWLWHFTWLFATPVLLLTAGGLAWRRTVRFHRTEVIAFGLAGLQYLYQWLDQFVRDGNGLEISYYWSFSYPTFAVALALFVGRVTAGSRQPRLVAIAVAWVLLLFVGVPHAVRLPSGAGFAVVAVVVIGAAVIVGRRSTAISLIMVLALVGWTQIGAPDYDPSSYSPFNLSPRYDGLFREAGDTSETAFHEAVWFEEEMDTIPNDASTSFVVLGTWASPISGLYGPHVVGHLVPTDVTARHLTPDAINEIRNGFRPIVAVFGPPDDVATMIATFPAELGVGKQLLDVTHRTALGYRLVVFAMPDSAMLPFTWNAGFLPTASGEVEGSSVVVGPGSRSGFVTFGPYVSLRPGRYVATVRYSSVSPVSEEVGTFDVSSTVAGVVTETPMDGTAGEVRELSLSFEVADTTPRWEFRTIWNGSGTVTVQSITLDNR